MAIGRGCSSIGAMSSFGAKSLSVCGDGWISMALHRVSGQRAVPASVRGQAPLGLLRSVVPSRSSLWVSIVSSTIMLLTSLPVRRYCLAGGRT